MTDSLVAPLPAPVPARERIGFSFVTLARRWRRVIDHALAREGLTDASWSPLIHLAEGGDGISQSELAQRIGLDASSLVRLIDLLAERGFVERRVDPNDRRARLIMLTPEGEAEVARTRAHIHEIEALMLADLSEEDLEEMMAALDKISARVQVLLEKEAAE
ncbi:MarR family winged helix-turn-helix transcriptional regulator [Pseudooceanicola nanhaiensis]|uniref:MarR family winged helix-turn-helix transcriptional regulator n=1 Tax=Pseudooceanicola nanhaiensis TaxID=375761 RepID=UPI001CD24901|nr:MarR family transcriptional regulator [Pseudooceanicola nanhaiensis]MCA0920486.1 MarR family transcriptional regulator [Pseudooceanicola nanhaiensis]